MVNFSISAKKYENNEYLSGTISDFNCRGAGHFSVKSSLVENIALDTVGISNQKGTWKLSKFKIKSI